MTTELQNKVWSILPKEFKEEVKKMYKSYCESSRVISSSLEKLDLKSSIETLEYVFGIRNLTSDAEGEEMLYAKRSDVIKEFYKLHKYSYQVADLQLGLNAFRNLYGSKCLPDEKINPERLVNTIKESIEESLPDRMLLDGIAEPKPAEPKFKVGDEVVWDKRIIAHVDEILNDGDYIIYSRIGKRHIVHESDLEPYTEPSEEESANTQPKSVEYFHLADEKTYLRNYSRDSNRLQIAAMAMQGILANGSLLPNPKLMENEVIESVASLSVRFADTLIAEAAKKGGAK